MRGSNVCYIPSQWGGGVDCIVFIEAQFNHRTCHVLTEPNPSTLLPTSHPSEDAWMARRQQNRAAQDSAVGRKILDRASKSVTSCNVDSPETKWCDSFSQSKGGKLFLAHMCSFLRGTRRLKIRMICSLALYR